MPRTTRTFLMLGALLATTSLAAPATARAQGDRSRVDTTVAFGRNGSVDLGLVSGEIIVTGWTRAEARVNAWVERGTLDVSFSPGQISVQTRSERRHLGEARYELMVPIGTRVAAHAVSGDIRIKATAGEVEARSVSGDIEVLDATNRVTINAVSGNAHVANVRGSVRYEAVSGDFESENITGDIEAHTVSGEITARGAHSSHVRAETVSGGISYRGSIDATGSYDFSSHSGDVTLEIPNGAGASLALQSYSGEISSRFPMTLQPGQNSASRRGRRMEFTIDGGGARVTVETFSGDITIERGASRTSKEN